MKASPIIEIDGSIHSGPRPSGRACFSVTIDPRGVFREGYPILVIINQTLPVRDGAPGLERSSVEMYCADDAEALGLALQRAAAMARLGGAQ